MDYSDFVLYRAGRPRPAQAAHVEVPRVLVKALQEEQGRATLRALSVNFTCHLLLWLYDRFLVRLSSDRF